MKTPRDFAEDMKAYLERLKPNADNFSTFHQNFRRVANQFDSPGPAMRNVTNFNVPGRPLDIPVRLYEPMNASKSAGPTLVFLHGGGWVVGSLESHESLCLRMASGSGFRVLSVDYRLAPASPYPAAPDDCEQVLKWALSEASETYDIDRAKIAICGDSAGGNMSAYLGQKYRDKLKAQILYYPVMQLAQFKPPNPGPQDVLQLGVIALKFIDQYYVKEANTHNTRLSPLFETDLAKMPPTYLLTCGLDPLRDEGKAYADKLAATGTKVVYHHEAALPHGFLNFSRAFPKAKKIPLDVADFMREHMV